MVLLDPFFGKGVKIRLLVPISYQLATVKVADVEKCYYQVVERAECLLVDRKGAVAISLVAAFDLYSDLACDLAGVGVDANEVVALIVRRCFESQNIPSHQVADREVLCA